MICRVDKKGPKGKSGGNNCQHECKKPKRNLYEDLCRKTCYMYEKLKRSQPKKRICELAIPKYRRIKYRPMKPVLDDCQPPRRQIQIVRDRSTVSTRNEQLAFSPVRRLIAIRNANRGIVSPIIYERYNKYIHRGMYSLYARLANTIPPVISNPIKPWTKEEWDEHTENFKRLSIPKKIPKPPPIKRKKKSIEEFEDRLDALATPKMRHVKPPKKPDVSPAALKYVASERTNELSKPKASREPPPKRQKKFRGKKFEVSDRTKQLAQHREKKTAVSDTKENPYQVSPNALKAKTSERVKTLATPKDISNPEPKDPLKINPAALKAKPSKRIIELAQPKNPVAAKG